MAVSEIWQALAEVDEMPWLIWRRGGRIRGSMLLYIPPNEILAGEFDGWFDCKSSLDPVVTFTQGYTRREPDGDAVNIHFQPLFISTAAR